MRKALVLAVFGIALVGLLPAAQGAPQKIRLVSCVNTDQGNEPGELNRCKDGRSLRYDFMEVTDGAIYTTADGGGLEVWPVTADGKLSVGACYKAYSDRDTCSTMPEPFNPGAMAASPDGRQLYVADQYNGITILDIGPNGALTYRDCMGAVGGEGACSKRFPAEPSGIFQLRVSPDGERLYAFDYRGALSFRRLGSGALEYLGCLKLTKSVCKSNPDYGFTASHAGVAISPDSKFVYTVGGDSSETYKVKGQVVGVISVLARIDSAPGLKQVQLLKLPVWGYDQDKGRGPAAVPADGRHLYAAIKERLVTLARNKQSGTVRVTRCLGESSYSYDTMKCAEMSGYPGLFDSHAVTLTRNGRGLALAGYHGISMFKRKPATGALGAKTKGSIVPQACAHTQQRGGPCATDLPFFSSLGPITFSRRSDRLFMTTGDGLVLTSATTPFGSGATRSAAAAAAVDHRLGISSWMVGTSWSQVHEAYSRAEVKPLTFALGLDMLSEHGESVPTTETVSMTLPKGLSWGPKPALARTMRGGAPYYWTFTAESQACTVEGQVATCQALGVPRGTNTFGWILDVEAAAAGKYTIHGEVVPPTDGRNRVPRGPEAPASADLELIVGERTGKLIVGKVRLSRFRPSIVEAEISLNKGGVPAKADSLTCTTDFPTEKSYGGPNVTKWDKVYLLKLAPPGEVHCLHGFNNRRYEGKLMTGITEFTVGKQKVTRKYSVRIGTGTSLSGAKGAIISK